MLIDRPVLVEVYARPGCDAAAATLGHLAGHGIHVTPRPMTDAPNGHYTSPAVVIIRVGEGNTQHIRTTWGGHRPDLLDHAITLWRAAQ